MKKFLHSSKAHRLTFFLFMGFIPFVTYSQAFNVVGNAKIDTPNCYQVTGDTGSEASAAWYNTPVNINYGFDVKFNVFMGDFNATSPDLTGSCNIGADGMCFVLQNSNTGYFETGGGIGYEGFPNQSLAIELDTWQNGWDPPYNHIAIECNGSVEHPLGTLAGPVQMSDTGLYAADGKWHTFEVIWDPQSDSIRALFDDVFRVGYNFDSLGGLFQGLFHGLDSSIYWGFTGSTGLDCNITEFCPEFLSLGIENIAQAQVKLFPNPATDQLNLEGSDLAPGAQIRVMDMSGRILITETRTGADKISLNVRSLAAGMYIVELKLPGGIYTSRFMKVNNL